MHPDARAAWETARIVEVSCGAASTFARTSDGRLFSWGWNAHGVLGHGSLGAAPPQPAEVDALPTGACFAVACGAVHAMSVTGVEGHPWALLLRRILPTQPHPLGDDVAQALADASAGARVLAVEGGKLSERDLAPPAKEASGEGAASSACDTTSAAKQSNAESRESHAPAPEGRQTINGATGQRGRGRAQASQALQDLIATRADALARLKQVESASAVHAPRSAGAANGPRLAGPRAVEMRVVQLPKTGLPHAPPPENGGDGDSGRGDSSQSAPAALADIVFVVEGHAVWAHTWVMEARCGALFRAVVRGVESQTMEDMHDRVPVVELRAPVRLAALLALLEYLYTDSFEFPPHRTPELLALADALSLVRPRHARACLPAHTCFPPSQPRLRDVLHHRVRGTALCGSPQADAGSGREVQAGATSDFRTDSERLSQTSGSTFVHDMLAFLRGADSACVDVLLVPGSEPDVAPPVPALRALLCRYPFFAGVCRRLHPSRTHR